MNVAQLPFFSAHSMAAGRSWVVSVLHKAATSSSENLSTSFVSRYKRKWKLEASSGNWLDEKSST